VRQYAPEICSWRLLPKPGDFPRLFKRGSKIPIIKKEDGTGRPLFVSPSSKCPAFADYSE
jgi:hypothetical protein